MFPLVAANESERSDKILLEPYDYISKTKGKEIRPQLIDAFNYWIRAPQNRVEEVKQIVQKLHNASLLIDDIEDNSHLRRGQPTAHKIYGEAHVINTGNFVYFLALQDALSMKGQAGDVFCQEMVHLHRGQGWDIFWRDTHTCPTEDEYLQMVADKTGGLFRLAVGLMCLFGSDSERALYAVVNKLALFFQILDDYLNLQSQKYFDNKSFCEDLTEGKFSFPIIHSIRLTPQDHRLSSILRQRTQDVDVKRYALRIMEETGSFQYTRDKLQLYYGELRESITSLGENAALSAIIEQLASTADIAPV
eukprot:TRINITY_DN3004_c0_g1_i1.p2 TRINITY_DN3004_c0_g1~~TRINITY_DN3004_c0_g1_i1.p2  ORF type:complete len:306 (-),score=44.66 TRINITY_DN3004_c0_g1_i1:1063-1980(-)